MPMALSLAQATQRYTKALTVAAEIGGKDAVDAAGLEPGAPIYAAVYARGSAAGIREAKARLGRTDLYFLLRYLLHRKDVAKEWIYQRCREVQNDPNGKLDLWAREHFKSTIITFGRSIQDILNDAEITIGLFSHTRPAAKKFLVWIKTEFENNAELKETYPEVLYADPQKDSPKWSENDGIVVKRTGNPKESTVEAWGLTDGPPTGAHFKVLVYDDVVTLDEVSSPPVMQKVTVAWENSLNLGMRGGARRHVGTPWHHLDTYTEILNRGTVAARRHPATVDGTEEGDPVLLTREELTEKRRDMGAYVFGCQMLVNPRADALQGFKREWLRFTKERHDGKGLNKYLLIDPASGRKKTSGDYTSMFVIGLGADRNMIVLDMVRDRLNLTQRTAKTFDLVRQWQPLKVGYEVYGLQADVEHIKDQMERENYRFEITELGGSLAKVDRIKRLVPICEQHRFYLPPELYVVAQDSRRIDLVKTFIEEEYEAFPVARHDDMLDCASRIEDPALGVKWPIERPKRIQRRDRPAPEAPGGLAWLSI